MFKNNYPNILAAVILILILLFSLISVSAAQVSEGGICVSAKSAALYQPDTGRFAFTKNSKRRMPMASTTKIMTALVAIENISSLDEAVEVDESSIGTEGSSAYLKSGDVVTVEELLYALLLQSANDAAVALAVHIGGSVDAFADMMNERAEKMGLSDTHFANPHGLDADGHYTTAEDLAKIAAEAIDNETIYSIVSTYKKTLINDERRRTYVNHNKLLNLYDGAIGVKTGFTDEAGRCLVGAAERDGVRLISVTLDAPSDWQDHEKMLDFGFDRFVGVTLAEVYEYGYDIPLIDKEGETLRVTNTDELSIVYEGDVGKIEKNVNLPRFISSPVKKGDIIGTVSFTVCGRDVGSVNLCAVEDSIVIVEQKNIFKRIFDKLFS